MSEENPEIELRSDEVQEILSFVPNWMIRWGITMIFGIILMLIFTAWFIKYPDVISGEIVLTTNTPPSKIVSLSSGNIQTIFLKDKSKVAVGDKIAEIETGINPENIEFLKTLLSAIDSFMADSSLSTLPNLDTNIVLGVMQQDYNILVGSLKDHYSIVNDEYYSENTSSLEKQIEEYKRLLYISKKELSISKKELDNAKLKYETDKKLYEGEFMAKIKFKEEETKYYQTEKAYEGVKKELVQVKITITQLEKQLNELKFSTKEKERGLISTIRNTSRSLKNSINTWKHRQIFTSPIEGELCYLKNISKNQFINQGEEIFAIIPKDEDYIGYITLPVVGAGKVKEQQRVRIRLNNYPSYEYGEIRGIIEEISLVASDDNYRVKVSLPNKLVSSYNKTLNFRPEMSGKAEIITEDLRLIERIFNNFRELMENE